MSAIEGVLLRCHGHRGARSLIAAVQRATGPPPATRSDLERRFLHVCDDHGLPRPVVHGLVLGYEVDAHWPGTQIVVELDSYEFHHDRAAFERDRVRDAKLQRHGFRVLRVTWRRLVRDPAAVADDVRALLASGTRAAAAA
jgi:hypothetical protein